MLVGSQGEGEGDAGFLKCFGQQLRLLRTRKGLSRAELGALLGYGEDQIASVELGRRIPKPELIDAADDALDADGMLKVMKEEVAKARYPAFFRDAAKLEREAVELHVYANQAVPGLLQTEEYARAVFEMWRPLLSEETVSQRVAARLARQQLFSRQPHPTISFVIEESSLRRPLGNRAISRGQLEQILLYGHQRNVEIQVMPTERSEHAGLGGPFTLIETREGRRISYMEVNEHSRLYTERPVVRGFEERYGILRAQGLTPSDSLSFVEKLLGDT
ncbi:helix-turn-helix domain-containing protein [Streptomyces cavernicola]|uniref:Helix-turn-helix transcriptional regulator n=1 Tax=Streptomyces cavernicola TaxID=3043613 RepID=A0ABT6SAY7_9ACTN|nr:helix-turn-helix transcriptional regulator [Streptomyces sp. B-S-A6]MDI3405355.1 helix-turn-helix transcriptional regulator [Streptomyces sp. B-S-A6]